MIGLPHLMILQYIKRQMRYIRANPEYLIHALEGYDLNEDVRSVFGSKRIDDGVLWLQQNEFNYVPLYNFDTVKFPNICVSYEGGAEGRQFIGDYAGSEVDVKEIPAKIYVNNLTFKGITDERTHADKVSNPIITQYGYPIVSSAVGIRDKVWRGLKLTNGIVNYKITGFRVADNGLDTILVTDSLFPLSGWSGKWTVMSNLSNQSYILNSSLDNASVKVELLISSDPEVAEMVACVLKYVLKGSRFWLCKNGFQTPVFSQSSMMKVQDQDNPTWSVQFTITGQTQDTWITTPIQGLDYIDITVESAQALDVSVTVASEEGASGSEVQPGAYVYQSPPQTPKILFGVAFANNNTQPDRYMTDLNNFEAYVNTKHDLFLYFSPFDSRDSSPDLITPYFYTYPLSMWNAGKIPVLTWYPSTSTVSPTPVDINIRIINGEYDAYLNKCFAKINQYLTDAAANPTMGTPKIYMRFAHEMNMKSHAWSGPTPTDFINMWRYVYTLAQSYPKITKETMQWVWCPSCVDINTPSFENYYPGDEFVDWTGLDGYNWKGFGANQTFEQVFEPALIRVKATAPTKPVMIAEFGVGSRIKYAYDIKGKAKWVRDSYASLTGSFIQTYNIKAAMYYNITLNSSDIDAGIFLPSTQVVDMNSLDTWYTAPDGTRYYTFSTIRNDYGRYYQLGFNNIGVKIDSMVFKGSYPNT